MRKILLVLLILGAFDFLVMSRTAWGNESHLIKVMAIDCKTGKGIPNIVLRIVEKQNCNSPSKNERGLQKQKCQSEQPKKFEKVSNVDGLASFYVAHLNYEPSAIETNQYFFSSAFNFKKMCQPEQKELAKNISFRTISLYPYEQLLFRSTGEALQAAMDHPQVSSCRSKMKQNLIEYQNNKVNWQVDFKSSNKDSFLIAVVDSIDGTVRISRCQDTCCEAHQ